MSEHLLADLRRLLSELPEVGPLGSAGLGRLAERLAAAFDVEPDEVAILALSRENRFLKFLIPEKLQAVGTIPMTSTSSLAVRTVRDRRPEFTNNFTSQRHASVFEGVPLGRRPGETIHKIMSVPVAPEGKVLGVVQISRKGRSPADAGPDFTQGDLRLLISVSSLFGPLVERFRGP